MCNREPPFACTPELAHQEPSPSGSRAARAARVRCRLALTRFWRHIALLLCALQCAGAVSSSPCQWRHADTGASHAKQ